MTTEGESRVSGKRVTRRAALRLFGSTAAIALLVACGRPAAPAAAPTAASASGGGSGVQAKPGGTPVAAGAPKPGGTLRVGLTTDLTRLDIHYRDQTHTICYDALTSYDENWKPTPALAESWDVSPDAKQVKFNLRKGVQFHDGREFTSDDVKWSYTHAATSTDTNLLEAKWWTSIETPDKYTVVMTSDQPRPMMFDAFFSIWIVDKNSYDANNTATNANGTGPFKLANWKQGSEQTYSKNPSYWRTGQPYFDGINVAIVSDIQALTARLEAGALDALPGIAPSDFLRLSSDARYAGVQDTITASSAVVSINTKMPPWDNKQARQALFFTFDRDNYVKTILKGLGASTVLGWPTSSPAYDARKDASRAFNIETARQMLKDAGVTGSVQQEFGYPTGNAPYADLAQAYQSDMANLGIKLTLKPVDIGALRDAMNNGTYNAFALSTLCCHYLDPGSAIMKSRFTTPTQNNSGPYVSQAYSAVCNQLLTEPDPTKRKALFDQYNDVLLDEAFIFPVGFNSTLLMTRANVKGVSVQPNGTGNAWSWGKAWFDA